MLPRGSCPLPATVVRPIPLLMIQFAMVVSCSWAGSGSAVPSLETIVARMAEARTENRNRFRAHVVTRDYQLFDGKADQAKSHVTADVAFAPPDSKSYVIQRVSGSGFGERIVRRMLEGEVEVAKDHNTTEFSPDNYDFRFIREDSFGGRRCYVIEVLPKRPQKNLLRGHIWVDSELYLIHRSEGEPSKKPSWWLRDVHMVLSYGDVGGMWLQTNSEATADVRLLGRHKIVSRAVRYQMSERAARLSGRPAF